MALYEKEEQLSNNSFKKHIEESSMDMVMDILQSFQYSKPIQSCVREACLNAIDSVTEKNAAKMILSGKAQVSDYYLDRKGDEFKSSVFNADYYNLDYLNDSDTVQLIYKEVPDISKRDVFVVKDRGVGLGGDRLEGFMSLSYSTKRNSKNMAGKWGLGNKAPLATGIESFRIVSHYNGRKYAFDIFSHSCQSVIGKFSEFGLNNKHEFKNGYVYYSEPTTEKNSVEIHIPVKKHNKQDFINAVRQQLLYIKADVQFFIESNNSLSPLKFKPDIAFENDDVVIPVQSHYLSPHIVLSGTCYGLIDFCELELENRTGCIGIKVNADEVDVSPSRETVLWTQKTKDTISKKFEAIRKFAIDEVNDFVKSDNFFEWYSNCVQLKRGSQNKRISTLYELLRKEEVNIQYNGISYNSNILEITGNLVKFTKYFYDSKWCNNSYKRIVKSSNYFSLDCHNILSKDSEVVDVVKTQYLIEKYKPYFIIRANSRIKELNEFINNYIDGKVTYLELYNYTVSCAPKKENLDDEVFELRQKKHNELLADVIKLKILEACKIHKLSDVKVPSGFTSAHGSVFGNEEELAAQLAAERSAAMKARRKNKSFPYTILRYLSNNNKIELKETDITQNHYYCFQDEEDIARLCTQFKECKIGRVSKDNAKYFNKDQHFSNLFGGEKNVVLDDEVSNQLFSYRANRLINSSRLLSGIFSYKDIRNRLSISDDVKRIGYESLVIDAKGFAEIQDAVKKALGIESFRVMNSKDAENLNNILRLDTLLPADIREVLRDYAFSRLPNGVIKETIHESIIKTGENIGLW